jgi:hypothetical protein
MLLQMVFWTLSLAWNLKIVLDIVMSVNYDYIVIKTTRKKQMDGQHNVKL